MVRLKALGGAALEGPDGPLTGSVVQRLRVALLTVLAVAPAGVSRETLLALLWPDSGEDRARHALSNAIYAIRRALGENAVLSVGNELRLSDDVVTSDIAEFSAALDRGDLEAAAELYAGPLLDGFHLDNVAFERWQDRERDRLEARYREALERLATEADRAGDTASSARWWHRLCAADPYNARNTIELLRALEAAGDPAGALRQARVHEALLEELGAEPDPTIRSLADAIRERMAVAATVAERGGGGPATAGVETTDRATEPPDPAESDMPAEDPVREGADGRTTDAAEGSAPGTADERRSGVRVLAGVLAVALLVVLIAALRGPGPNGDPPRRIAVLPLNNLSASADDAWFADAMTELLTAELSRMGELTVRSRTSATRFGNGDRSLGDIARELDVDALIEGSIARQGDQALITIQLVRASPEEHLWAGTYEGDASNALSLQRRVVRDIVDAIRIAVSPAQEQRLAAGQALPPEAQDAYLRGLWRIRKFTRDDMHAAIESFETVTGLAPDFTDAWVLLGDAWWLLTQPLAGYEPTVGMANARAAAERALALDPESAGGHVVLGWVQLFNDWDPEAALHSFEVGTNGWGTAWIGKGFTLAVLDRPAEAIAALDSALALDPFLLSARTTLAEVLYMDGRPDEAVAVLDALNAIEPDFPRRHTIATWIAEQQGDWAGAVHHHAAWQRAEGDPAVLEAAPPPPAPDRTAYWAWRQRLLEAAPGRVGFFVQAQVAAGLGDIDGAFELLDRSFEAREGQFALIGVDPRWDDIRADPRFNVLVERAKAARGQPMLMGREPG